MQLETKAVPVFVQTHPHVLVRASQCRVALLRRCARDQIERTPTADQCRLAPHVVHLLACAPVQDRDLRHLHRAQHGLG
jgi:hypothetical protein